MTELIEYENNLILISLLITVCMQLCFFAIAYTLKIDKVTDFAGTSNFIVLAAFTLWLGNDFSLPKILATLMVCLWGFRLGGYLFYRILIWGEDHRFDKMRERFWSFLGFWIMQILWVFLLSLPVTPHMATAVPTMGIDNIWNNYDIRGEGVSIAIVDTGVNNAHVGLDDFDGDQFTNDLKVAAYYDAGQDAIN